MKKGRNKKFKVGELVKLTEKYNQWYGEHADEIFSVRGGFNFSSFEEIIDYGVCKFSYPNSLDIYGLIEGDNGSFHGYGECFAYRVYYFNELGFGWHYVMPKDLERL